MVKRRLFPTLALIIGLAAIAMVACSESPEPTATNVPFNPTPAGGEPTPAQPTPTSSGSQPTATSAPSGGDAARGEQLFASNGCSGCHSTGDTRVVGPGLAGIGEVAGTRTSLSADAYLHESIVDPGAYVVEGYGNLMPSSYSSLPEQDIQDLIAYLKTLE